MGLLLFSVGVGVITSSFFVSARGGLNILLFKVVPVFAGLYIMYYAALDLGWILNESV
jgi:hypothetical protein